MRNENADNERKKHHRGRRRKKKGNIIANVILVIALIVFCVSGFQLFKIGKGYLDGRSEYDKVRKLAVTDDKNKNDKSWSNSVEVKAKAASAKPTVTVKSSKKGYVTASWSATDVEGYDVYYGTSKTSIKKALAKGTTKKSASKKLTSGKTYYFRARAYKTVNGKKVYTDYSSVKKIKIK